MDMQTIIKNSVGTVVTDKLTKESAVISGVDAGAEFAVYVSANGNLEKLDFMQFVSKYNLDFSL